MEPQSNKARMLGMIRKERDALDALVASLSDGQMLEPGLGEGRSVKDLLLHVTAWERRFLDWMAAAERGEMIGDARANDPAADDDYVRRLHGGSDECANNLHRAGRATQAMNAATRTSEALWDITVGSIGARNVDY